MALDIGGGRTAPPRPRPLPRLPMNGPLTIGPGGHANPTRAAYNAPVFSYGGPSRGGGPAGPAQNYTGGGGTASPIQRFFQGAYQAYNPRNIPQIPAGLAHIARNPEEALIQMLTTPEGLGGLAAGAVPGAGIAGIGGKIGRIGGTARMGKAADRAKNYPSLPSGYFRLKNRNMGAHAGFGGRLGNPMDRAIVEAQRKAPSMQEHLAKMDALEAARKPQGAIPKGLEELMRLEEFSPHRADAMRRYTAHTDRPVADIFSRQELPRMFPEIMKREPPRVQKSGLLNPRDLLPKVGGGELPLWLTNSWEHGVATPRSLTRKQGLNQSVRKGSFSDSRMYQMNPQMLADMLSRPGFFGRGGY